MSNIIPEPQLRRYRVLVREIFEDTILVVAPSAREARRIALDNFDPDMCGQDYETSEELLEQPVTPDLPEAVSEADEELSLRYPQLNK